MKKIIAIICTLFSIIVILIACQNKNAYNTINNYENSRNTNVVSVPEDKKYRNNINIQDLYNRLLPITKLDETYKLSNAEIDSKYNFLNLVVTDCQVRAGIINQKYIELAFFKMGSKDQNVEAFKFVSARKSLLKETLAGFKNDYFLFQQDNGLIAIVYAENAKAILQEVTNYMQEVS